jgi:hypothetical protein
MNIENINKKQTVFTKISKAPNLILIAFIVIILITIIYSFTFNIDNKNLVLRFNILSKGIGILVIYAVYLTIRHQNKNEENLIRQNSFKISQDLYNNTVSEMMKYFPETLFLYSEINGMGYDIPKLEKEIQYNPYKREILESYFGNILLENLENWINLRQYITSTEAGWRWAFYIQFTSPILTKIWEQNQFIYDKATNQFIRDLKQIAKKQEKEKFNDDEAFNLVKKITIGKLAGEREKGL